MKREAVLRLKEKIWCEGVVDDLAVAIIPSSAAVTYMLLADPISERLHRQVCEQFFVDFRNWEDNDGNAIPNTLEARMEIWALVTPARAAMAERVREIEAEVFAGEAVAASG